MSFSFGFNDDDIATTSPSVILPIINPLDDERLLKSDIVQPELQNLQSLLQSLKDVRITFETFKTPQSSTTLFRRELFDVKHQLMSEFETNQDTLENDILIGETSEDVRKNVYEGGLKSWECSIDLVDTLTQHTNSNYDSIVELGCGTSLPTEYLFNNYLQENSNTGLHIILADYNKSVLRLVTLPNLIVTWVNSTLSSEQKTFLQRSNDDTIPIVDDELLLTSQLLDTFYQDLLKRNIIIDLISGSWGCKFNNLLLPIIKSSKKLLVLTSETIYQPDNLPVVAETLFDIIKNLNSTHVKTLIAAKDIYFGVGGSIVEFENYLTNKIKNDSLNITFQTFKVNAGLKRSIISME